MTRPAGNRDYFVRRVHPDAISAGLGSGGGGGVAILLPVQVLRVALTGLGWWREFRRIGWRTLIASRRSAGRRQRPAGALQMKH